MSTKKDLLLKFFIDITKSDMLHFGYWDLNDPLTVENLHKAQSKYVDLMIGKIPKNTKSIVDVGCGTGITASKLQDLGYSVECVTPDLLQKKMIGKKYGNKLTLYCTKFEELDVQKSYDLILMMESFGYLKLEPALQQCSRLLNNNGSILIADIFRQGDTKDYKEFHILDVFIEKMKKYGFKIKYVEDITLNVAPTIALASWIYHNYAIPITETALQHINNLIEGKKLYRIGWKIFRFLFKKNIMKLSDGIFLRVPRILDKTNFLEKAKYMIYLLERS